MANIREVWWQAGQLADVVSDGWRAARWVRALRRSATLLEPAWPEGYSGGTFTFALPTVTLVLYAGNFEGELDGVPVERIVSALAPGSVGETQIEDTVRRALADRRHDLEDDSRLSALVRQLTEYRPPLTSGAGGLELPSMEQWPGGTLMCEAARWAAYSLTHHHLSPSGH